MISVIIPLYNKEKSISSTIESVLSQTYKDFELIIINDGSTDKSEEIIRKYLNDSRIKYYYKTNSGVSSTRNYGINIAKGEWILFLDADDELSINGLNSLSKFTEYNVDIISGTYIVANNNNIVVCVVNIIDI